MTALVLIAAAVGGLAYLSGYPDRPPVSPGTPTVPDYLAGVFGAVGALRRLAERVEATHVKAAREAGWSREQIGDALGVSRQSVHAKYAKNGASDV